MITASVEDTAAGRWVVLECQHPVPTRKYLILGGKSSGIILTACGERFVLGQFTDPGEFADRVERHVNGHQKGKEESKEEEAQEQD